MMMHHKYLRMLSCDEALSNDLEALREDHGCGGAAMSVMAGDTVHILPEGLVASFNSEAALGMAKAVGRECSDYLASRFDVTKKRTSTRPRSASVRIVNCGDAAIADRGVGARDNICAFPEPRQQPRQGEEDWSRFPLGELRDMETGKQARLREVKPIRIIVVQSNPDHYWCSCSRLKAQGEERKTRQRESSLLTPLSLLVAAYTDEHGYVLHWILGAGEDEDPSDPVAAKWRKYKEALKLIDKSELIVMMDCDIFVTNTNVSVTSVWSKWAKPSTKVRRAKDV